MKTAWHSAHFSAMTCCSSAWPLSRSTLLRRQLEALRRGGERCPPPIWSPAGSAHLSAGSVVPPPPPGPHVLRCSPQPTPEIVSPFFEFLCALCLFFKLHLPFFMSHFCTLSCEIIRQAGIRGFLTAGSVPGCGPECL